jgi:hypothetical protein
MAVDPSLHRLYLLEGGRIGAEEASGNAYAKRILIFSTIPQAGKLVPPSSGPTSLPMPSGTEQLVLPKTIAVDPTTHDVEVMAQTPGTSGIHTVLQRVSSSGALGARFVDAANKLRPAQEIAASMTVGPTGKTYVLTGRSEKNGGTFSSTQAWELPPSLAEVKEVSGFAATAAAEEWPYGLKQEPISQVTGGAEIAISPDGSTLYWKAQVEKANPAEGTPGNYLIHGFSLSEGATAQIYGGSTSLTSCRVTTGSSQLGVSGEDANEHLVVLDTGPPNEEIQTSPPYGGKVLVFGRGGSGCPVPTAKFKANGTEEGLQVAKNTTVTFDASSSELASGPTSTPGFRKELIWKFGDGSEQVVTGTGGGEAPATVTHKYTSSGTFTAGLMIRLKNPTYGNPLVVEHKVQVEAGPEEPVLTVTGHGSGAGKVTSSPAGIDCGAVCAAEFTKNAVVTLTGAPAAGSKPATWSGCDKVNGSNQCEVTMSAAKAVVAIFDLEQHPLKVSKTGTGSGTVTSAPTGINCGGECEATFAHGTVVKLSGTPTGGSKPVVWSGCDAIVGSNECEVTMNAAATVTATFAAAGKDALGVTKAGTGSGTVTSVPAGIECGSACAAEFTEGTVVKLTGSPGANGKAVVWSGCDAIVGSNQCEVTMSAAKNVTATFDLERHLLKVTKAGSGTGTVTSTPSGISCGGGCEESFDHGVSVTLKGVPDPGTKAVVWSGCDAVVGSDECAVSMTAAKSVTATFSASPRFALGVTKEGEGLGSVTSAPAGIDCGSSCSATFGEGETVTLTATPSGGSTFAGWKGCATEPTAAECQVAMSAARNVTAKFAIGGIALTVTRIGAGGGTVTSAPAGIECGSACRAGFASEAPVTLTARPDGASVFSGWSGCDSLTAASQCVVKMARSRSVTASFLPRGRLLVARGGSGTGAVSSSPPGIGCGGTCEAGFGVGVTVILTGTAATGSKDVSWSGCATVTASNQCLVTVAALSQVGATFDAVPAPPAAAPPSEPAPAAEKKQSRKQKELARCKELEGVFKSKCIAKVKQRSAKSKAGKKPKKSRGSDKKTGKHRSRGGGPN